MDTWPALRYETLPWEPSDQGPKADRHFRRYDASIPAFISDLEWRSSAKTATVAEEAIAEIVRLDATAGQVLAPLCGFLLRNEAESSSKIELVQSTPLALARATLGIRSSDAAISTLAAAAAIEDLISVGERTNPADPANLNHAHAILMRPDALNQKFAGGLRDQQNWIGGSDHTPRGALFVPPEPGRVVTLMADLHDFCDRKDLPALAQAAIAHAQFETIHPYTDGNGRLVVLS
ncbi:Fic family protein [Arthrobacter sp. UYCu723]